MVSFHEFKLWRALLTVVSYFLVGLIMGLFYNYAAPADSRIMVLMLAGLIVPIFLTHIPYLIGQKFIFINEFEYFLCVGLGGIAYVLGALVSSDTLTVMDFWWELIPVIGFPLLVVFIYNLYEEYYHTVKMESYGVISIVLLIESLAFLLIVLISINYTTYPSLAAAILVMALVAAFDIYFAYHMGKKWEARIWYPWMTIVYAMGITALFAWLLFQNLEAAVWGGCFGVVLVLLYMYFHTKGRINEPLRNKRLRQAIERYQQRYWY